MGALSRETTIAWVITPHGLGHAARSGAIMAALRARRPKLRLEIFTTVPPWFFEESIPGDFGYHGVTPDLGLVQRTPLAEDLPASARLLTEADPLAEEAVAKLAGSLAAIRPAMVVCDIAPQGILAAKRAGLQSVLVENFTWDWIYEGYADLHPDFGPLANHFAPAFAKADLRIQTTPVGRPDQSADLVTGPVGRRARQGRAKTRQTLGLTEDETVVLVSFGGISDDGRLLARLPDHPRVTFVVPGSKENTPRRDKVIPLTARSGFFHPDLVAAADAVVSKAGYSIVAEVYRAGLPLGYFTRERFRESATLEAFIGEHMEGIAFRGHDPGQGLWIDRLDELLCLPAYSPRLPDGDEEVADFLETKILDTALPERTK